MLTILEVIRRTTDFFRKAEVPNARLDAELLIGHGLGLRREQLYVQFERPLAEEELERIRGLVKRRASREPLQYIIGEVEFDSLRLKVDRRALIPRPETEEFVDLTAGLAFPLQILDLGTGTGSIVLALLRRFPEANGLAVDSSDEALELARENAKVNDLDGRVRFLRSDWYSEIDEADRFDLIVSNPPYLSADEWESAQEEVKKFEPREALFAEGGGRAALEAIIADAPCHLTDEGWLGLETGIEHHAALTEAAEAAGFARIVSGKDLSGRDRFFWASKRSASGTRSSTTVDTSSSQPG